MRVISGEFKGRKLKSIDDRAVRPTLDRVKESIFNVLGNCMEDAVVVDFFSGFGSLGIEALSRGAKSVLFVEKNFKFRKIILENLRNLIVSDKRFTFENDVFKTLERLTEKGAVADVIFADPPYLETHKDRLLVDLFLEKADEGQILSQDGIMVVEHLKKVLLPETLKNIYRYQQKVYGTVAVSFYCNR